MQETYRKNIFCVFFEFWCNYWYLIIVLILYLPRNRLFDYMACYVLYQQCLDVSMHRSQNFKLRPMR